eukprot:gene6801-9316_t
MNGPYKLINSIHAHDGPIRCLTLGPNEQELVTGNQSDNPNMRRWMYDALNGSLEDVGADAIYHDHWVTSVTSLPVNTLRTVYPQGCIVSGCMDTKIRIFDSLGVLMLTLEGHAKGVISLNWTEDYKLLSGSWDGTASMWDVTTGTRIKTFGPHENGVHVMSVGTTTIATISTGESVNGKPANYRLRFWDIVSGNLIGTPIEDHHGSIRSIAKLPGIKGFATSSNDGTVILRTIDGQEIGTVFHQAQEDGSPPFILDCCALDLPSGMDLVSCGEDGSCMVWSGTDLVQSIMHPQCVWCVLAIPNSGGDFVTGCNDGVLRVFSRVENKVNNARAIQYSVEFDMEVSEAINKRRTGPSKEELAKCPLWELRGSNPGKSENQVMVFNKDGSMIAAQWNSGSWIIIGEVTGSGDGGNINGVWYDHVMPVEIETATGLKNLQLGHNNGENSFVAAQRFIDQNQLPQSYLGQIADWIVARAGKDVPTIGQSSSVSNTSNYNYVPSVPATKTFSSILSVYAIFEDIPPRTKIFSKIQEFNSIYSEDTNKSLSNDDLNAIDTILATLSNTSRYHATTVTSDQLRSTYKCIQMWDDVSQLFPAYDIFRMTALHPGGSETLSKITFLNQFYYKLFQQLSQSIESFPVATALTMLRFLTNIFRFDILITNSIQIYPDFLQNILHVMQNHMLNKNKLIRSGVISIAMNMTIFILQPKNISLVNTIISPLTNIVMTLINTEIELQDIIWKGLCIFGTMLLNPITSNMLHEIGIDSSIKNLSNSKSSQLNANIVNTLNEVIKLL